ncbi:DUF2007 domain-containing protein [Nocardioides daphniae]|uniref:DUF2007 domain-containing protein n=1 Tax=Nocardioides daphniae TaxID=402297 RepID=A0A4P7UA79_9ACTN|nr:DUF2007 domain-containing protein [Nocardioides daphniae]QCC76205.1 DUF2007 domain-containing protein [Nocardioides daphniae]GGD09007.1 hypothetical protein GCM10007231_04860 [Nocardioides daphniae]
MVELVRSNDVALVGMIEALLQDAGIPHQVTDRNMSAIEGSIMAIPMRVMVPDEQEVEARQLLTDADLGSWLRP